MIIKDIKEYEKILETYNTLEDVIIGACESYNKLRRDAGLECSHRLKWDYYEIIEIDSNYIYTRWEDTHDEEYYSYKIPVEAIVGDEATKLTYIESLIAKEVASEEEKKRVLAVSRKERIKSDIEEAEENLLRLKTLAEDCEEI